MEAAVDAFASLELVDRPRRRFVAQVRAGEDRARDGGRRACTLARTAMISWIKNLVSVLASPLFVAVVLGVAGAVCRSKAKRTLGTVLLLSAVAVAYLGATHAIGNAMLVPLEQRYPPLSGDPRALNVSDVVVLGSSYSPVGEIPVTGALDETGLVRIVEGVRLTLRLEQRGRLIVSGGAAEERNAPALGYAELARSLGSGGRVLGDPRRRTRYRRRG